MAACGTGGASLLFILSQRQRKYSAALGLGVNGYSAGGGIGLSSGPFSTQLGQSSDSRTRMGIVDSRRRRVSLTHWYRQSDVGMNRGGWPSWERMSVTASYQPRPASCSPISSSSSGESKISLHLYKYNNHNMNINQYIIHRTVE